MANSLIATTEGLERVDTARKRAGWNKTAKVWLDTAEISKSTMDRFWAKKPIRHENFVAICQAVGVDWESVADLGKEEPSLNILLSPPSKVSRELEPLATKMRGWFEALRYEFETHSQSTDIYFEWLIRIPVRGGFDRVVVQGVHDEIGLNHLHSLGDAVARHRADEGWLVSDIRVSPSVQEELRESYRSKLCCLTFDELIDRDADFTPYIQWLEKQVKKMNLDRYYIRLSCKREELDPATQPPKFYPDSYDIEKYLNEWIEQDCSEHISIVGEFGTGKTWFTLHYAWACLKHYREAIERGFKRPRLPLLITLRDYNKGSSVENILADFFYFKHNIRLNQDMFDALNKMGKILTIFDGFDEIPLKSDLKTITNDFDELSKVIVPGSKVIITSRTKVLSNREVSLYPLRLETLELELFDEPKIKKLLSFYTEANIAKRIVENHDLLELLKKPILISLVSAALPEIDQEEKTTLDLARVYLCAVKNKMEREIKSERIFKSLADKLYFMCEVSWEMLSTDRLSLHYSEFPPQLQQVFGKEVAKSLSIDPWQYDLMQNTILIRDGDGNYTPAHRSLLDFFVAYKFAAELGLLNSTDFIQPFQNRPELDVDISKPPKPYKWSEYWHNNLDEDDRIQPLEFFERESLEDLRNTFGRFPLTVFSQIMIDFLKSFTLLCLRTELLKVLKNKSGNLEDDFVGGNIGTLLVNCQPDILINQDLKQIVLRGANLENAYAIDTNLTGANLSKVRFAQNQGEAVYTSAFSPDTKWLVTGSEDGILRLWRTHKWQEKFVFKQADAKCYITVLAWSPDGGQIVSGDERGRLKIWNVDLQQEQIVASTVELDGADDRIRAIAWSSKAQHIASSGRDKIIRIWDAKSGRLERKLTGHESTIRAIAWSPDNRQLATGSRDQTIKIWDIKSGNCTNTLTGHKNWIRALLWSDNQIISAGDDNNIRIWDAESGAEIRSLVEHEDIIRTIDLSPDRQKLLSGSDDTSLKVWEIDTGRCIRTYTGHKDSIKTVSWSPDGDWLYSSSSDKTAKRWNFASGECQSTLLDSWGTIGTPTPLKNYDAHLIESFNRNVFGDQASLKSLAWSPDSKYPDGKYIVTGSRDQTLKIWDVETGKCVGVLFGHGSTVRAVAWSPDGTKILSGSRDETLKIWDVSSLPKNTFKLLLTIDTNQNWIRGTNWSLDGTKIASGGDDGTIKVWDAETGALILTCSGHKKPVRAVAWSPDGTKILSASDDKTLKIWDATSGDLIGTLAEHQNWVRGAMWSPDGQKIVSSGRDRSIKIWNAETGKCLWTCSDAHESAVRTVAWSHDGKSIVSGSDDYTVKVWNWDENKGKLELIRSLEEHKHFVSTVAWSPDSAKFASGSRDKTVKIWDAETGECLHTLRNEMYAGMKIKDAIGLTPSQIENLKSLGAID